MVGAVAVALLLLLAPNLLKELPSSALAAVVIASAIGLFEFADLRRIFRIQRWEFWLSVLCFVGVATLGVIPVTSGDVLAELVQTLRASGIELRFAEMKDPVKDRLKRFELFEDFGAASFHPTLGAAVDAYLEEHSVDWKP